MIERSLRALCVCTYSKSPLSTLIDLTLRHLCVMINTVCPTDMVNDAAIKVRQVRQEEFMIPEFVCVKMGLVLSVCVISIYAVGFTCCLWELCVCVCVFYKPSGVLLCHQIQDSGQHAFEEGRTSVKLIVPLHIRPACSFWGNTLSAGIQGNVWKEEGIATIWCSWEILWSTSDFLLPRPSCRFLRLS